MFSLLEDGLPGNSTLKKTKVAATLLVWKDKSYHGRALKSSEQKKQFTQC